MIPTRTKEKRERERERGREESFEMESPKFTSPCDLSPSLSRTRVHTVLTCFPFLVVRFLTSPLHDYPFFDVGRSGSAPLFCCVCERKTTTTVNPKVQLGYLFTGSTSIFAFLFHLYSRNMQLRRGVFMKDLNETWILLEMFNF